MNHRHHHNHHSPRFKEGDVVWAKSSSTKWSPAVILNSKLHPKDPFPIFSLSFFDDKFPRYRVENELRSFEKHFPHYVKHLACTTTNTATTFKPLLDRVLKYLGEREELNLKCRCLVNSAQEKGGLGKEEEKKKGLVFCFRMEEVLGYMRDVSVEGFVEEVELVGAAKMAARVQVIRKFFEVRERDFLREVRRIRESQMAGCLNDFNYLKVVQRQSFSILDQCLFRDPAN